MRSLLIWILAPAVAALGACALLAPPGAPSRADRRLISQGQALAQARCLACHGGADAAIEKPPPMAEVARRWRGQRLDWELETITAVGHYRMRPTPLSPAEIKALAVYIQSLERASPSHP